VCFEGPEDLLKETRNTQPALFAVECAVLMACRDAGLVPNAVAGHSIGEYAALVAAGVFDVAVGAQLVKARADAMMKAAETNAGTMVAVLGLDTLVVADVCKAVSGDEAQVVIANDNCPGQLVISGNVSAVEAASPILKERGAKRVMPLAVSGAFHSPLMQTAADMLDDSIQNASFQDPTLPIVANVSADYETSVAQVKAHLAAQVAGPVRWTETVQRLVADGYTTFVECGPGKVLAGLIKRIAPDAVTYSVGDRASLQATVDALRETV
jgi:[acyl-carrier-protein] S-malonyltransferase